MNEEIVWKELRGTLWQYVRKEHMEETTREVIKDEEWELFVHRLQNAFADEVSQLAREFWLDYRPSDWE